MRFITVIVNCGLIILMPTASRFTHPPPQTLNRFDFFVVLDLADFSGFPPANPDQRVIDGMGPPLEEKQGHGCVGAPDQERLVSRLSRGPLNPANPPEPAGTRQSRQGELTGPRWGPWASEITARSGVTSEKATAGFGVTHGLHRQSPPAHPHTGMKVATIADPMPGLRIDFGENDRMDRGSNPSRSSLSFDCSFDPSWGSSWSLPEGHST